MSPSRKARDLDEQARALILEIIPLVHDPEVAGDQAFNGYLASSLAAAESDLEKKPDRKPRETITNHGKTVES